VVARIRLRNHRIHRVFICARRQLAGFGAVTHHHDAIRDAHHFLDLRRDEQHSGAAASQLEDRSKPPPAIEGSAFEASITSLRASLREGNRSLDELRAKLDAAG